MDDHYNPLPYELVSKEFVKQVLLFIDTFENDIVHLTIWALFQVRIRTKKSCKPLEEDAFRPILYHYDGPKFRLQLSVPEVQI